MNKVIWMLLVLVSGAFLPIQAGLNARVGKVVENPVGASLVSFVVGAVGLVLYMLLTRQSINFGNIQEAPRYIWIGGLLGAFYVTVIVLAFPKLGPGWTFGLIVAGQMITAMLLEHFNILVAQPNPINAMKLLGVALIVVGVVIIRSF